MVSSAISIRRDYELRRDGRELVVYKRGKHWGLWPHCAGLVAGDVVEQFKADLAELLDWELENNFVIEDA